AVVDPVPGELVPGRLRLGALVLVVRKDQVLAAAVDVDRGPEVARGHRRALDVPSGTAGSPGRPPGGLPGLRAFPQDEVPGIPLPRLRVTRPTVVGRGRR